MEQYLEDLSEDWISQPRSSPLSDSRSALGNITANKSESLSTTSQQKSRIPRFKAAQYPTVSIENRQQNHLKVPEMRKNVLTERSLSDANIALVSPTGGNSKGGTTRATSRSLSTSSLDSVMRSGTTQKQPARTPHSKFRAQDTPEWKRRLLGGGMGYRDQKDLFSPMGLENIFQKPQASNTAPPRKTKKKTVFLKEVETMPSSPPPWSSNELDESELPGLQGHLSAIDLVMVPEENEAPASEEDSNDYLRYSKTRHMPTKDNRSLLADSSSSVLDEALVDTSSTTSGQLEQLNEEFSPVFISKHNTADGCIGYAPLDFVSSQMRDQLESVAVGRERSTRASSNEVEQRMTPEAPSLSSCQTESLPEDLLAGTPDISNIGAFVNTRRGEYSADGSFQQRPLSPSPPSDICYTDKDRPQSSSLACFDRTQKPTEDLERPTVLLEGPSPPLPPVTPSRRADINQLSPNRTRSSGSPLKLFGDHDTFTSNRLLRRISQLEDSIVTESQKPSSSKSSSMAKQNGPAQLTSIQEASFRDATITGNNHDVHHHQKSEKEHKPRISSFGEGDLNGYTFPENLSILSSMDNSGEESILVFPGEKQNRPDKVPPVRLQSSPICREIRLSKRRLSKRSGTSYPTAIQKSRPEIGTIDPASNLESDSIELYVSEQQPGLVQNDAGKRPPTSPFKNPTPKRRRTLPKTGGENENNSITRSVRQTHDAMQSGFSRKRKDARQGNSSNMADPEIIARRQILRPRNPTPSQRRREEIQTEVIDATELFMASSPRLEAIKEHLQSPVVGVSNDSLQAQAVAREVAAFTIKMAKSMEDDTRKRSVTTQDFLDEAMKIMEFIRTKSRPRSGLGSLEESQSEDTGDDVAGGEEPPSTLTFSRPPTREGIRSGWRNQSPEPLDPKVLVHLQKFAEKDDDDFIVSSVHSLNLDPGIRSCANEQRILGSHQSDNIRITENISQTWGRARSDSEMSRNGTGSSRTATTKTHTSTESSLARTIVTNTSRKSDNVATLAPDAVAHLIPDEVAGMSFDRERGVWVKRKLSSKQKKSSSDTSSLNESEDDPLGKFPDLTVDDVEEGKRLARLQNNHLTGMDSLLDSQVDDQSSVSQCPQVEPDVQQTSSRPRTREGPAQPSVDISSAPSKHSHFTSSGPFVETRATSWTVPEGDGCNKSLPLYTGPSAPPSGEQWIDTEHEIKVYSYGAQMIDHMRSSKSRCVISPPSSSSSRPPLIPGQKSFDNPSNTMACFAKAKDTGSQRRPTHTPNKVPGHDIQRFDLSAQNEFNNSVESTATRSHLLSVSTATHRKLWPTINEQTELSLVATPLPRPMRFTVSLNATPSHDRKETPLVSGDAVTPGNRADLTFLLSDLPDFTVNQVDERELPERNVIRRTGLTVARTTENRFELGTVELVKAIQDMEPEEPYWDKLRVLDLHNKGLPNLHELEVLCYCLEELNISGNNVTQLSGIPSSIRRLNVSQNSLSNLTTFAHLVNLQYLDVSNNGIHDLDAFTSLVHLRELRANSNDITNIDGVLHLDGLLSLSLRNNRLQSVGFKGAELPNLTHLDLAENQLTRINNLEWLISLKELDLDDNHLEVFPSDGSDVRPCNELKTLQLRRNQLHSLNVNGLCPNLKQIYVDGNRLQAIDNLRDLRLLETVSAREQYTDSTISVEQVGLFLANPDVRSLYLSANPLPRFGLQHDFMNLQYLEIASAGLQCLPENLGCMAPNIRVLNLNFNAIKDLKPLLNIRRLQELTLAGNRLSRLRKNLAVLARLRDLTKLDLRDNPFTLGFYEPMTETRLVRTNGGGNEALAAQRYVLAPCSKAEDESYLSRLDEETKLRRRVYEILLATSCRNLADLDGLVFDSLAAMMKDCVWERLCELGVIKKSVKGIGVVAFS
ncbi:hypothetical protein M501DRAFT_396970 [Patellaria atrata CBS 101060]|uniref:Septation initiation network scaffold protein cdc11 n=1 Tax=Patellaria atrata CBS 101060 TaxID=1346257 RepID=A0A9P4SI20_9PEZI|nr:hypothetical protein M501DRAFT_396970 [Patellaria atrata CBS 101060]